MDEEHQTNVQHNSHDQSDSTHFNVHVKDFGRLFLTGQTHESSFRSRLCRAEVSERCPVSMIGDSSMSTTTQPFRLTKISKREIEPAFRANNNKKVVLCGHSTDDIITYRFLTSSVVDQSWIDTYIFAVITSGAPFGGAPMADGTLTQDCACLHWMIPNKNTFDDDCVVVRLKSINATAGVILNATSQRWSSDTHSDYYMDGDGTVPTVSLSSILQDAVPITRILDIIAQATAEEMEYDDSLNPPDFF
ncbi:hypothetical protein BLNAU_24074 [Blattamonas nauphoetae]|uniref:Uncharacterized protein n=1 Tax=Blattamonas nauphoetae TaxID=2049346 RepID=A0ABQ9WNE1_9EUKA|nr:hypothetical protein BLNAU_24074 [Blattamonas nauphoetae]